MKKGFTLIELMIVIVVIGALGVAAVVAFSNADKETTEKELENKYKEIQKSAGLYLDLNISWLEQFSDRKEIYINLNELKNSNFINQDLTNPVTGEEIDTSYSVKLFVDSENSIEFVNSCIVSVSVSGNSETVTCIANSDGKSPCDYETECN